MKDRYRLYQRENGVYYWQENGTNKQGSLRTKDRREAQKLVNAKNESHREPTLNLSIARAYLAAHDPSMSKRTWREVMHEMERHGIDATRERCARTMCSRAYDPIRDKPLVQTTAADLLAVVHANGNSIAHYLRRLHNLAVDLGWLPWPVLTKRSWPKKVSKRRRAVTADEHTRIMASEKNPEKRAYYQFLYETGAAQSDAAEITAESIDWQNMLLVYRRKKLGPDSEPARLSIGKTLRQLLETLPKTGPLFPTIRTAGANARSTEFSRRCRIAGVSGVSLHSYRHSWAQRAKACGYPQRFAQEALGHSSRAVHEAYAKGAMVILPALDEYESLAERKVIAMPLRITLDEAPAQAATGT
ncbi:MAG TPA: tyrosine-type recombinase/integrase [Chthoniobacterales bacterium]